MLSFEVCAHGPVLNPDKVFGEYAYKIFGVDIHGGKEKEELNCIVEKAKRKITSRGNTEGIWWNPFGPYGQNPEYLPDEIAQNWWET